MGGMRSSVVCLLAFAYASAVLMLVATVTLSSPFGEAVVPAMLSVNAAVQGIAGSAPLEARKGDDLAAIGAHLKTI